MRSQAIKKGASFGLAPFLFLDLLNYFRFDETLLKVEETFEPRVVIALIAATAMRAAIRPYSIAVAPLESLRILRMNCMINSLFNAQLMFPAS